MLDDDLRSAEDPGRTGDYAAVDGEPDPDMTGTVIADRYKLLQRIGEGGMGAVYLADQTEPVRRRVAVKVIKPGMDSVRVLARFEAERQALALMDHPHIARLLDAGVISFRMPDGGLPSSAWDSRRSDIRNPRLLGRPFFVMDLVKGLPITRHCDEHKLSVPDRLRLFVQVCYAVQHAHQKGIIHRDLKPSNILIESHSGKPVPKVIDFGLAKAVAGVTLTDQTLFTALGQVAGTPLYMAPEQAAMNGIDVDTRADIYALGVILYELLTGTTPIEKAVFRQAAFDEKLRMVRELDPPTPSSRLSTVDAKPVIAANRQLDALRLNRFIKGELDWITLKALSKDRDRRYETANGFAQDVERFLNHEPVIAGPPSAAYRLRKFARRNRAALVAAGAIGAVTVAGAAVGAWQAVRATAAAARAEREWATSQAIADFVRLDLLAQVDPKAQALGRTKPDGDIRLRTVLDRAAAKIGSRFADRPVVDAALRATVGGAYWSLGDYPAAQPHLERALEIRRRELGDDHPDTLASQDALALEYIALARPDDAETLLVKSLESARRVFGPEDPRTLETLHNLSISLLCARGQFERCEPMVLQLYESRRRVLGDDHPDTLTVMCTLGAIDWNSGRNQSAVDRFRQVHHARGRVLGDAHPDTLVAGNFLASVLLHEFGKLDDAEPLLKAAVSGLEKACGADHPDALLAAVNLASLHQARGRFSDAEKLLIGTIECYRRALKPNHPDTISAVAHLGMLYQRNMGRPVEAVPLLTEVVENRRRLLGGEHHQTLTAMASLAAALVESADYTRAEPLCRELLEIRARTCPPEHVGRVYAEVLLGLCLRSTRQFAEAETHLRAADAALRSSRAGARKLASSAERLAILYDEWGKPDEAARWRKELEAAKAGRAP